MRSTILAAALAALSLPFGAAQDPADSWLAYAKAPGNGRRITNVSMIWVVPALPAAGYSDAAPGFWYGIEPSPALDLLQPILALDDIHNGYSCFLGHFDWHNGGWDQSDSFDVQPGETIFSTTTYDAATNSYQMMMMSLDHPSNKLVQSYPVNYGETFTDLYVVVEKQPPSCDQYPSNGQVIFANISAAWEGVVEKDIPWFAAQYQPACDSTPHILNNSTVSFTWSTSGPAQAPKDSAADASAIIPRPPRRFRRAAAAKQA